MVEASTDFHNFEGDESLSGSVLESHFSFRRSFPDKFDCYDASWCAGETSAFDLYAGETNDLG